MRKTLSFVAVGAAAALALTACSSSGTSGNTSTPPAGNSNSSTPSTTTSSTTSSSGTPEVGVILPDTTSSTRYTEFDAPLLTKYFKAANIPADIENAGGDKTKFASIATNMISEGVKVLIIDSIDAPSGAAVEQQAKQAGIPVIDYDRVNLGGSAQYYVSFDNEKIGEAQGQAMLSCLKTFKEPQPAKIIEMDGGTDVDYNAVLFQKGVQKVFNANKNLVDVVSDQVVKGWTVSNAAPAFTQALQSAGGSIDGVYAANDDIANAVIGVLKQSGQAGKIPVTGQDSGVEGLQNILSGDQCATIYKSYALEAQAASKLAIALIQGKTPASAGIKLQNFYDPTGKRNVQAYFLPFHIVTIKNMDIVVKSGQVSAADLCKGFTSQCQKAGIKP